MNEGPGIHKGHRDRVKEKFLQNGFDGFADHELLEFLLFYCIPMKDTNELAHSLINEFGSISGVFEARPEEIQKRCKVSRHTAVFLSMVPQLTNYYLKSKWEAGVCLDSHETAGEYVKALFAGKTSEMFYLLCLNSRNQLILPVKISEGTINEAPVYVREAVAAAVRNNAVGVILAHNHPGGSIKPSESDREATGQIIKALETVNISVLDHIVTGGGKFISFAASGMLGMALK